MSGLDFLYEELAACCSLLANAVVRANGCLCGGDSFDSQLGYFADGIVYLVVRIGLF